MVADQPYTHMTYIHMTKSVIPPLISWEAKVPQCMTAVKTAVLLVKLFNLHEVILEFPGVSRVLCPACRLGPDWCYLLIHRLGFASVGLPELNRCRTRLSLHYT